MNQPTFAIAVAFEIKPEWVEAFRERVIQQAKDSVGCEQATASTRHSVNSLGI